MKTDASLKLNSSLLCSVLKAVLVSVNSHKQQENEYFFRQSWHTQLSDLCIQTIPHSGDLTHQTQTWFPYSLPFVGTWCLGCWSRIPGSAGTSETAPGANSKRAEGLETPATEQLALPKS